MRRIQEAARRQVVLLIAAGGYGKSEALTQYLARTRITKVVCRLPKSANSLPTFIHALADACSSIAPEMASSAASALNASLQVAEPIGALVAWAGAHLSTFRGIIALDDFENADERDERVVHFLDCLIMEHPAIRWMIASRYFGSLPIANWIAKEISDIPVDTRELTFTPEEAVALAKHVGASLDEQAIRDAVRRLAGWPFALAIEFRSSVGESSSSYPGRQLTSQYLETQFWSILSDKEQRFSELAAVVPNLTIQLAVRAGFDEATRHARSISSLLPFASFDGTYFAIHDLFRSFITQQITLRGHSSYIDLLLRAARALAADDRVGEALELVMQTKDLHHLQDFIVNREIALCNSRYRDVVKRALYLLARETSESITFLKMVCACDDVDLEARQYGKDLLQNGDLREDLIRPTIIYVSRLDTLFGTDTVESARSPFVHAALKSDNCVIAVREAVRVWSKASQGDFSEIRATARYVDSILPELEHRDRALVLNILGCACIWADKLDLACRYLDDALAFAITAGDGVMAARSSANRVVAIANNPFTLAGLEDAVERARHVCQRGGHWTTLRATLQAYGTALVWSGRLEEASAVDEELGRLPKPIGADSVQSIAFIRACINAMKGDLQGSGQILLNLATDQLGRGDPASKAYAASSLVILAIVAALGGSRDVAEDALRRYATLDSTKKRHPCLQHGEIIALMALGRFTLAARAARKLDGRVGGAASLDRWYHILQHDRNSIVVRSELAAHRRSPGFGLLSRLLERTTETWDSQRERSQTLTRSELAILQMLSLDMSNKEIALARSCSEATVKVHVGAILRKLGADSRRAAVAIARKEGLLN